MVLILCRLHKNTLGKYIPLSAVLMLCMACYILPKTLYLYKEQW
ncbi:hypothetical protein MtrunA17_Chr1g0207871 [Medicago truncatula]|uniref:Transmembrane protein n=1 Tax=Medicago truncatula TaxID=3880 RepID=A0A396K9S5_MEDTR|nr:hypothetical protein MtrunA17_Chr1g0207871 [Medicago truncatula]